MAERLIFLTLSLCMLCVFPLIQHRRDLSTPCRQHEIVSQQEKRDSTVGCIASSYAKIPESSNVHKKRREPKVHG